MNDQDLYQQYLHSLVDIFSLSECHDRWSNFWKYFHASRLSLQENDLDSFVTSQCRTIAKAFAVLGKENEAVQKFLAGLPLRYSQAALSWPSPTSEEVRLIMTD